VAAACGGSDSSAPVLGGDAGKGQQLAKDRGCTSCHTANGARSEGPTWKGLAGSNVTLTDGTTVVADDAYLTRSITDPRAQVVSGSKTPMPPQKVSESDVPLLVAYIKALK
jgi:cytochrome c oxidase subunit 2